MGNSPSPRPSPRTCMHTGKGGGGGRAGISPCMHAWSSHCPFPFHPFLHVMCWAACMQHCTRRNVFLQPQLPLPATPPPHATLSGGGYGVQQYGPERQRVAGPQGAICIHGAQMEGGIYRGGRWGRGALRGMVCAWQGRGDAGILGREWGRDALDSDMQGGRGVRMTEDRQRPDNWLVRLPRPLCVSVIMLASLMLAS